MIVHKLRASPSDSLFATKDRYSVCITSEAAPICQYVSFPLYSTPTHEHSDSILPLLANKIQSYMKSSTQETGSPKTRSGQSNSYWEWVWQSGVCMATSLINFATTALSTMVAWNMAHTWPISFLLHVVKCVFPWKCTVYSPEICVILLVHSKQLPF